MHLVAVHLVLVLGRARVRVLVLVLVVPSGGVTQPARRLPKWLLQNVPKPGQPQPQPLKRRSMQPWLLWRRRSGRQMQDAQQQQSELLYVTVEGHSMTALLLFVSVWLLFALISLVSFLFLFLWGHPTPLTTCSFLPLLILLLPPSLPLLSYLPSPCCAVPRCACICAGDMPGATSCR